jgi:hypothetical protein
MQLWRELRPTLPEAALIKTIVTCKNYSQGKSELNLVWAVRQPGAWLSSPLSMPYH